MKDSAKTLGKNRKTPCAKEPVRKTCAKEQKKEDAKKEYAKHIQEVCIEKRG
ncbi:hypothetical protein [Brotaphodocola sp.]|uniref:hypothetical protein n=1 Tax=Brotaphodocola sp. TaxID=3073577 RepID=UPI003D7E1FCF